MKLDVLLANSDFLMLSAFRLKMFFSAVLEKIERNGKGGMFQDPMVLIGSRLDTYLYFTF